MSEQIQSSRWEQRLGDGLTALAEVEAPAASVTVADVIEAGRRQSRRRRSRTAFALSAVLIAAAALSFGALAMADHGGSNAPADDLPGPVASSSIGAGSDPAAPIIAFGWLPASLNGEYEVQQYSTGPNYNSGINRTTGLPLSDGPGGSSVQVWAPGDVILTASVYGPGSGTDPGIKFTFPAGAVDGHKAWWTSGAPGSKTAASAGNLVLMWQYEPSAWATIYYHGNTGAASGTMLLKVANSLVIGPTNPTALPFRLTGLPAGIHADAVDIDLPRQHGAQVGAAALRLCVASPCADSGGGLVVSQESMTWQNNSTFAVDDAPQTYSIPNNTPVKQASIKQNPSTPVTIDGHAAKLWTSPSGATLTFTYDGAKVTIAAAGAEYRVLGGESGFLAFSRSLTFLGSNPADWTTDVIG